jgi:hypothetical protein
MIRLYIKDLIYYNNVISYTFNHTLILPMHASHTTVSHTHQVPIKRKNANSYHKSQ